MTPREQVRRDARRLVMQHDDQFYGPMKGATCGCDECKWPRLWLALLSELEQAEQREAALVEALRDAPVPGCSTDYDLNRQMFEWRKRREALRAAHEQAKR